MNQEKATDLQTIWFLMTKYKQYDIQKLLDLLSRRRQTKKVKHDLALLQSLEHKYNMKHKYEQIVNYSKTARQN